MSASSLTVLGNYTLKTTHSYRTRGLASVQLFPSKDYKEPLKRRDTVYS